MKKILVLTAVFLSVATLSFAASNDSFIDDFAVTGGTAYGDSTATVGTNKTSIGKTSTGVAIAWYCDANGNGYALMSQHKSGTKAYGSSYDSTALYQTKGSVTPGTAAYNSGALTATDTTDFAGTGWSAM